MQTQNFGEFLKLKQCLQVLKCASGSDFSAGQMSHIKVMKY